MTKYCRDGGVCHHQCAVACFREDCCAPLSASNLNWNWTPKTRLIVRYKSHVLKVWHNDTLHSTMLKGWTVEGRIITPHGKVYDAGTSFRSFKAMLAHLKSSVDAVQK